MPGLAPSGQMRGVQPLTAKKPSDLARSCTSVRLLDDSKPIRGRELAAHRLGPRPPGPEPAGLDRLRPWGPRSLRSSAPRGAAPALRPGHRVCLCSHRSSPPRPTLIPRGAGVSGMLAERVPAFGSVRLAPGTHGAMGGAFVGRVRWRRELQDRESRRMNDDERRTVAVCRMAQTYGLGRNAIYWKSLLKLVRPPGFEPGALRLRVECSTN